MIFSVPILTLLMVSLFSITAMLWAGCFAVRIIRHWNLESGSATQILLEKQTYLVSTMVAGIMVLQAISTPLFVLNADRMAPLFIGAMCAVGALEVNAYGSPALILKLLVFLCAAIWLGLHHTDTRFRNYPLTRFKYGFLTLITPLILSSEILQFLYFINMDIDVITSCCSVIFTPESSGAGGSLSTIPPKIGLIVLLGIYSGLLFSALLSFKHPAAFGLIFSFLSTVFLIAAIAAIVSVISPYVYEQPHHHCPFCLLKADYNYIGYALYIPLFGGSAAGLTAGALSVWAFITGTAGQPKMETVITRCMQYAMLGYTAYGIIALTIATQSNLVLFNR